jgi:phosphomevalonate kinase
VSTARATSRASAPGKAIICGEYAVLFGAPALAMAVDRRAEVSIESSRDDCHRLRTPGLAEGQWRFRAAASGKLTWIDEPHAGAARLVAAAWRTLHVPPVGALDLTVDTRRFFDPDSGTKLGLGSSAAATVALVAALGALTGSEADIGAVSARAHRALQAGAGSGIDVATSVRGGMLEYQMNYEAKSIGRTWPEQLFFRFLWSGRASDTVSRVRRLDEDAVKSTGGQALQRCAAEAAAAWTGGGADEIIEALGDFVDALLQFSIDRDLGIFDAGHDVLTERGKRENLLYKPCGAGGGDIGIVLGRDDAALQRFCEQAKQCGFTALPLAMDARGVMNSRVGTDE